MIRRLGMIALILCIVNIGVLTSQGQSKEVKRHYPTGWTWKQEKLKHYANGSGRPYWMPRFWYAIAACEQPYGKGRNGVRWDAGSKYTKYQGAFGFLNTTWDRFKKKGYPEDADQASAWQQYQVALADYHFYGNAGGWGCYIGRGYLNHMDT